MQRQPQQPVGQVMLVAEAWSGEKEYCRKLVFQVMIFYGIVAFQGEICLEAEQKRDVLSVPLTKNSKCSVSHQQTDPIPT